MANVSGYTKAGADAAIAAAVAGAGLTTEQVQDAVAAMMVAGTNVTSWVYNDTAGTLTLNVAGGGGGTDVEVVRDTIGSALTAGTNISVTVNDAGDTITIGTTATVNATDAALRDRSTHTGTQAATTITGLATVATTGAYSDLSGKPTGVAGVRKRGYSIPAGSLDVWDAARAASASAQRDVVCFGDSTTEGILASNTNGAGYVPTLRSLAVAAGVTDGGRGQIDGQYDTATVSGEALTGFVSRTGWAASATNSAPGPNPFSSTTAGDVLTLQYKAPSNALRIRGSSNGATGRLTVAVDGTPVGTFDPYVLGQTYGQLVKAFTGLPGGAGPHTVTITNTGGAPIVAPAGFRTGSNSTTGGALAPGTYTWVITAVDGSGGETVMSNAISATVPAGTSTNSFTNALDSTNVQPGITKYNFYRAAGSTTTRTSFQLIKQVTTAGASAQILFVDNGEATTATNPPATGTAGLSDPANNGPKTATITVEFYDSTKGITFHRAGYSGQKYVTSFNPAGQPLSAANFDTQTQLGLNTGLGGTSPAYDWTVTVSTDPSRRKPALAICAYGINDQNQATNSTTDMDAVRNGVATFVRFCRAAGCDPLVVIPHLEYAVDTTHITYLAQVRDAILNTADAHGVAWVDFNQALPPLNLANATTYGNVHLTQAGYDAVAAYLWNNVLSATAAR